MAVKAINDTAGPDGLGSTLLVFGAYPRMTENDPPSPSISQRSAAIKKAMKEIHKWTGPFKFLGIEGETCTEELSSGLTSFRSNSVKPYYTELANNENLPLYDNNSDKFNNDTNVNDDNTPKSQHSNNHENNNRVLRQSTRKQQPTWKLRDADISILLQSPSFSESRAKEINGLLEKGVFEIIDIVSVPKGVRIYNSRFVDEVKNVGTDHACEGLCVSVSAR
ncbi:hypothetical protein EV44_g3972 [Erysiphe necator]|uniref:Uncharacterized protein n=1 Tax=Uncinula necator TaxID=52586 RepID=A0A0B1NX35_UNCNE|nr:hypothetical protein EV44_g3972 [Erysiphe necator]